MNTYAPAQKRQHDETAPTPGWAGKRRLAADVGLPLFMRAKLRASATGATLQRQSAYPSTSSTNDECETCNSGKPLQAKLTIGASDDPLEQEADRVAEQVLAMPVNPTVGVAPPGIQRYAGQASGETGTAPASVDRVLASNGSPLEPALQQDMSQRFGHDFSGVRVHADAEAQQAARDVNAHAYTVGLNVVFGAGQYAPESDAGRRLLAHELTHVVQQDGTGSPVLHRQEVTEPLPTIPDVTLPRLSLFGPSEGSATLDGFMTDSAELTDDHRGQLRVLAINLRNLLDQPPGGRVHIVGHTDRVGSEANNDTLGQERADAVRDELSRLGIDGAEIQSASLGESVPVVDTERDEPRNRRVQVYFTPNRGLDFPGIFTDGLRPPEPLGPMPSIDLPGIPRYDRCVLLPEICRLDAPRSDLFTPLPPIPERRLPSAGEAIWRPIDRALERGLRDLGIDDTWNQRLRDAARAGASSGASELLDQAMDAAHLEGETRKAVGTALRAAIQLEIPF